MIIAIRIAGLVKMPSDIEETLFRMRLRRKYSAVLLKESNENMKLLAIIRNFVAYGKIDEKTLIELIAKRGKGSKKIDATKIVAEIEKKPLDDLGLKPFFRLHSPRGGIESKVHFGKRKGVLGDNKEKINMLVRRML